MPAPLTLYPRPRNYDEGVRRFYLYGTLAFSGTYTQVTGIPPTFASSTLNSDGTAFTLPPTYTGVNGPGQGVACDVWVNPVAGYSIYYLGGTFRIYTASGAELATGTVPVAISGVPVGCVAEFLLS